MRFRFSAELERLLTELTPKQRWALPRVVAHRAEGGSLTSLLRGRDKICAYSTYYRADTGWHHQERWQAALEQAQQEYDEQFLESAVQEAVDELRRAAPLASKFLRQEIESGVKEQAGYVDDSELGFAERGLLLLVKHGTDSVKVRALAEMGRLAMRRRDQAARAAIAVADRADIKTAMKAQVGGVDRMMDWIQELREVEEDAEAVADVEAETSDVPEVGI